MRSFQNPREQCLIASVALGLLRRAVTAMHQEEGPVLWDLCFLHALEKNGCFCLAWALGRVALMQADFFFFFSFLFGRIWYSFY